MCFMIVDEWIEKTIDNYSDAENFIKNLPKFVEGTDLNHTKKILGLLRDKKEKVPVFHVAGTNGKGSVCAFLQSLLKEYGYCVGGFVSPHLVTMHERFLINGSPASDACFMEAFKKVFQTAKMVYQDGVPFPSFFEFLFLMGIVIFDLCNVDIMVLETGLGGRLDTTNVFDEVDVCVLTEIGLDHCQYLGDTREKIAQEKAGIIKKGSSVVFEEKEDSVSKIFQNKIEMLDAVEEKLEKEEYCVEKIKYKSIDFSYKSSYYSYISLTLSTCAVYQVENASLALRAFETFLKRQNLTPMSQAKLQKAIGETFWEGRMEEVYPGVFFDGAHNESGVQAFLQTIQSMECAGRRILCFSAISDKDYEQMIALLCESGLFSVAVAVEMEDARGIRLDELKRYFAKYNQMDVAFKRGAEAGIDYCIRIKETEDQVYIVGSLYFVGLIKAVFRRKNND